MEDFLSFIKEKSHSDKKNNKKFFQKLKAKPPRNLDSQMQDLHDEVFQEVDCLKCANCCKTTGPLFTSKDIERIAKHLKLKPAAFIEQYLRKDDEGDMVLNSVPCTFLDSDNYCLIYDVRPKACREYPHTDRKKFEQIGSLTIKNMAICPAAFKVVERLKKVVDF